MKISLRKHIQGEKDLFIDELGVRIDYDDVDQKQAMKDAKRIVACWNALEGINLKDIKRLAKEIQ